ncbi:MAG: hypothetical protein EZS26_000109 [Candidatus Ordinivivax streblomastigis]|uniref:Outer membrane protein beta-barrel domain-containing protein n=1 Tax=Candidatus Ordinivivax streblomastigis TaxID=2540710 RepID=A0A5M8P599_9BACT|nr:MAG: hypothetical protein EZS26_000109 [Candidatus Ordinivivax streblomastigis]
MKTLCISILFACIAPFCFAQSNYQDIIYLKNGSVIRGTVIEQVPNQSLKIETVDRNVFVYKMDEIEKMTKEVVEQTNRQTNKQPTEQRRIAYQSSPNSGYKGIIDLGYSAGVGNYGIDRVNWNFINGVQINPHFAVGLGFGLRYFCSNGSDVLFIPIFADFRVNFTDNDVSPYFALDAGYSLGKEGGPLLSPAFGMSIKGPGKSAFLFGIGYEVQKVSYRHYTNRINSGALSLKLGVTF